MRVYLDNGATTKVDPKVVKAMLPYFTEKYGNASSLHNLGQEAKMALDESREIIAKKIGAKFDEIIFTSGGTESDNYALKGVAYTKGKGHLITSKIEHSAILKSCESLKKEGFEITYLDVDKQGFVDLKQLKNSIKENTILVSIMHVNNEIGVIQDITEIGKICKEKNVLFHTDAVQSFCKVPIDVRKINVDLISMSAHKIHGPKGIGAFYIRKSAQQKLKKLIDGGPHEFKLRAGTENIPGIVGFARAVKLFSRGEVSRIEGLRDKLINGILKLPDVYLNGSREKRVCNNTNFSFKYIEGESLGGYLDAKGICTSSGSACTSRELKPSHVLTALGLEPRESQGSLRLTLGKFNTEEEVDYVLEVLPKIVEKLRRMSPLVK